VLVRQIVIDGSLLWFFKLMIMIHGNTKGSSAYYACMDATPLKVIARSAK
jgi:hypothetical protein